MIKNGLYSLAAVAVVEVGGVLILHDGKWKGEMISKEHTPTTRPMVERVQHIRFSGIYNDAGAEADATALVGKRSVRYDAILRLLVTD